MEYIYAALLLHRLKKDVTEENLKTVVQAAGITPDDIKVKALVASLSEVNIDEALKSAAFAPIATAPTAAVAAPAAAAKPAEAKKEEEKKEEEALAGLSSLFG